MTGATAGGPGGARGERPPDGEREGSGGELTASEGAAAGGAAAGEVLTDRTDHTSSDRGAADGALADARAGAAEAAAVRAEPPPVRPEGTPPGTYLAPGGWDVTCPFPCSVCRSKGRQ